ncbi:acyloxyacyl hydrolase [Roseovarius sp. SYSU LYC5161]|jgi:hypothetical protein|uniref:acyloxyacyl hydrolase n=1 Tax=Roseovarius halophilus (ex Wu et al. 2025) TaxID=3376060 RepID=UPI00399B11E5
MDGTLAAIYLIASLFDMSLNHCPQGCLARDAAPARLSVQAADVIFQEDSIGQELYLGYDLDHAYGPFQSTVALSMTDQGAGWAGLGVKSRFEIGQAGLFAEGSIMPGYHSAGDGPDLGGALQIRSALGMGYEFGNGASLSVIYDHRSNAETQALNPGLETLSIRYQVALD